ncbi:MAG: biopolymer transporter ExbD [Synechococcus sp. SB0673_bin_10]|nr:biopolymer transporter ExbD [Synechococcus sp. SB0673_bin_10]
MFWINCGEQAPVRCLSCRRERRSEPMHPQMNVQREERRNDEERVLPLINMVFLLLIFFMLAGKPTAEQMKIEPPLSTSQDPSSPQAVTLSMDAQGRLFLNAEMVAQDNLQLALARYPDAGNMDAPLVLRASAAAEAAEVVAVISRLRDAGIEQLQLLTIADHR